MKAEQQIKPCPFCGGQAEIRNYCKNGLIIKCTGCGINRKAKVLRLSLDELEEILIDKWNKRV